MLQSRDVFPNILRAVRNIRACSVGRYGGLISRQDVKWSERSLAARISCSGLITDHIRNVLDVHTACTTIGGGWPGWQIWR